MAGGSITVLSVFTLRYQKYKSDWISLSGRNRYL
jgi:hypothetical protein